MGSGEKKTMGTQYDFGSDPKKIGEEIFRLMEEESSSIFNKDWWYGQIMDWSMKNEKFKVQMFRFVDVLPYLHSSSEVTRHIKEYFSEGGEKLPAVLSMGMGLGSLAPSLMAGAIKKNVTQMAKMFISGENAQEALPQLKKFRDKNIGFTVDLLGEATLSEKEALDYQQKYLDLISWLAKESQGWKEIPLIDSNHLGSIPKVNVSVKLSALYSQINLKAWDESKAILKERLRPIFQIAKEYGVFINLDMEQYALKNLTLEVFQELIMEPAFKDYPHWGIVIQAYLKDSLVDVQKMVAFAKTRGTPMTIRLVKGAYWDFETVDSRAKNWPVPVYTVKKATDANFESCTKVLLENHQHIHVAIASHNVRSLAYAISLCQKMNIPMSSFEVQMLYGMADPIKKSLIKMGLRLRQYTPIGELIPGMAYLVRRLLENTSNESFLKSKFADNISIESLLEDPQYHEPEPPEAKRDFENLALLDFTISTHRQKMQDAIHRVQQSLPLRAPVVIDNREIKTGKTMASLNPSHPQQVVGDFDLANQQEADQALMAAQSAYKTWSKVPSHERCKLVEKVADLIEARRFELSAIQTLEVGKSWSEADADVAEAVDFCRYYAKEMLRLVAPQRAGYAPGELSLYHYQGRGIALVISPWNFPLAILTGQVMAAAVTGNSVIMKPAEQSSLIAYELMKIVLEAGFPKGVVNFLPGIGEEVGAYLVKRPEVALVAFTGSKTVGLEILRESNVVVPGQKHIKKAIIEMGGKNAIIIDSDADLDEAILGVLYSAFGFQGQKCSACSRVIVLEELYERFKERLVEAAKSLRIDHTENPNHFIGPVIDEEAQKRILKTIEENKKHFPVIFEGNTPLEGYFVPPTIFDQVDPQSSLAQEEIFGPVLAVIKVKNLEEALRVANSTAYALTGGLYSRSPENIEKIKWNFEVGNLYINRGITGALVERNPFGGFKMSGIGSKTGGVDYLLQFLEPRCVTENTLRRGFAPEVDKIIHPL